MSDLNRLAQQWDELPENVKVETPRQVVEIVKALAALSRGVRVPEAGTAPPTVDEAEYHRLKHGTPSPSTPAGREPESGEPQELFDALNLLLWHEVRVSNNRDGSVAAALVANRDEARRRVVAMFERASTLREDDAPRPDLLKAARALIAECDHDRPPSLGALERLALACAGAREDDAGGPP